MSIAGSIILIGGALGVLWKVITPVVKRWMLMLNTLEHFMRDWFGTDAEPGRKAVPGVMERLSKLDGELSPNHGSSLKDAVNRIEKKLAQIDKRLDEGAERFEKIEEKIDHDVL